ncbi:MAG TPA: aspartyl-phosphate phosphatase Spo0E family protein [Clostridia bacterium]|nr:aspartyl-phosphate phosphatase Spo0E family protein [Clostridia bacterium]
MKDNIERLREDLYRAAERGENYASLLAKSQKLDHYIVAYLRKQLEIKGERNDQEDS